MTQESDHNSARDLQQRLTDLEYEAYRLKLISDYVRELTSLKQESEILDRFVLMCMGALGADKALVMLMSGENGEAIKSRGYPPRQLEGLRSRLARLKSAFFQQMQSEQELIPKQVRLVFVHGQDRQPPPEPLDPDDAAVWAMWILDSRCYGLLGLGPKLGNEPYTGMETDMLLQLGEILMDSLQLVRSQAAVDRLNDQLIQKNLELSNALTRADKNQALLDRQVFHFQALSDTSRELSGILDRQKLMDAFLLMTQGTLSSHNGGLILYNDQEEKFYTSFRGPEKQSLEKTRHGKIKEYITSYYPSPDHFSRPEFRVQKVDKPESCSKYLGLPVEIGSVFSLTPKIFGLVYLTGNINSEGYTQSQQDLLNALTHNFLIALRNVNSFETLQNLNLELGQRNVELSRTLEELRRSQETVNVLQKARNRVRDLIQSEALRLEKIKVWDFIFIIGLTLLISLPYNSTSPGGISVAPATWSMDSAEYIDLDWAALKYQNETALFVDARPHEFFSQESISGAVNLPTNLFDFVYMMRFANLDKEKELIVFGRNISRRYDEIVAHKLMQRGHRNVMVMPGGLHQWKNKGMPVGP